MNESGGVLHRSHFGLGIAPAIGERYAAVRRSLNERDRRLFAALLEAGDITAALEYAARQSDHPVLRVA